MKIISSKISVIDLPFDEPISSSTVVLKGYDFIIITLQTDEGVEGIGHVMTPGYGTSAIYSAIKDDLCPFLIGKNPFNVEYIWEQMGKITNFIGNKGVVTFGISAIDMCLWDIIGKACNQPLYKILGVYSNSIPVYASGGWLSYSVEELIREMSGYVEEGYNSLKMKIGNDNPEEDFKRINAVRNVVGNKVKIMVDANQKWSVSEAIRIGKQLQELDVSWFEEPVSAEDLEGQAKVTEKLDLSVAAGESAFNLQDFKRIITNH